MKKRLLAWALLCAVLGGGMPAQAARGTEVIVLKVGKADAILLACEGGAVLIDTGEDDDADEILDLLRARRIPALTALILTHFDSDHVGGAHDILGAFPVDAVYQPAYAPEDPGDAYGRYRKALEKQQITPVTVRQETELALGGVTVRLLPTLLAGGDDNDNSLVISARDAWHSFLFAADATERRIGELLDGGIGPHDVLKMPHHGRYKDNLPALLDAVAPRLALLTDSDKNPAEDGTLALLSAREIETYQTRDGDIRVQSGPSGLEAKQ